MSPEAPFRARSTPTRVANGRYLAAFDESWAQGPGVYGGLTAATMYRACLDHLGPTALRLRSMALQYLAPVAPTQETEIEVELDRQGAGSSFAVVRLRQEGRVQVHALVTFGRDRVDSFDEDHVVRPAADAPDTLPALPYLAGVAPVFTQHVDFRFASGLPFLGGTESRIAAWLRFRQRSATVEVGEVLGLLDAPPPAVLARSLGPRPASTVTFQLHLLREPPPDPDGFWFTEVTSQVTSAGWSDEQLQLFGPDGRLVAIGRQLVAILR